MLIQPMASLAAVGGRGPGLISHSQAEQGRKGCQLLEGQAPPLRTGLQRSAWTAPGVCLEAGQHGLHAWCGVTEMAQGDGKELLAAQVTFPVEW